MMDTFSTSTVLALCIATLAGLLVVVASRFPSLADERRRPVNQWYRRRFLGVGVGGIGGAMLAGAAVWLSGADRSTSAVGIVVADTVAGALVGLAFSGFRAREIPGTSARVARTRHITFDTYIGVGHRWSARVVGALAIAALIGSIIADVLLERFSAPAAIGAAVAFVLDPPILLTSLGVVGWVLFEVLGRHAAAQSGALNSRDELEQDDYLRRQAILDLAWVGILLGGAGVVFSMPALYLAQATANSQNAVVAVWGTGGLLSALAALAVALRPLIARHGTEKTTGRAVDGVQP